MFSSYRQELNFRLLCFFSLSSFVSWAQINIVFVVPLVVVCFFGILIALNYIILKQYWPTEISCSSQHSTTICEQNSVDCAGTVSELPTQNAVTLFSSLMFSGFHYHSLTLTMSWYFSGRRDKFRGHAHTKGDSKRRGGLLSSSVAPLTRSVKTNQKAKWLLPRKLLISVAFL